MRNRLSKQGPEDVNEIAIRVFSEAYDETPFEEPRKNRAAVELGKLGGLKGGKASAAKLLAEKCSEIAKKAAKARWSKE